MPGCWNCVNTYSEPVPFGRTREPASASTPGAGNMKKSTTPERGSASTRMPISPFPVATNHLPWSARTDLAKPTAQRGRFCGSARNFTTLSGEAWSVTRAAPRLDHAMIRGDEAGRPFELQPEPSPRARRASQPAKRDRGREARARDPVCDESFTLRAASRPRRSAPRSIRSRHGSHPRRRGARQASAHAAHGRRAAPRRRSATFDPATTARRFVIAATDFIATLLMPALLDAAAREAPGISLEIVPSARRGNAWLLETGDVDLALGAIVDEAPGIRRMDLLTEGFACAARKGHPRIDGALDLDTYVQTPHLLITLGDAAGPTWVDQALPKLRRKR